MKGESTMRKINTALIAAFMLALFAPLLRAQDVYTDNVVIVFDDSGSMDRDMSDAKGKSVVKMTAAKLALHEVLKQVPDSTHIGLLSFQRNWIYKLGKKDDVQLKKAIDSLRAGGGTPLGKYMKAGADALLVKREQQHNYGSYKLLVLTDGEAGDKNLVEKYTPDIVARGITLDVIGVKMAKKHTLANYAHSYRAANDPEALKQAIKEVLTEKSVLDKSVFEGSGFDGDISGISPEIAMVVIEALSNSGNHPIGTKPKPKPQPVVNEDASKTQQVQQTQQTQQAPLAQGHDGGIPWWLIIIGGIFVVGVIGLVLKMGNL